MSSHDGFSPKEEPGTPPSTPSKKRKTSSGGTPKSAKPKAAPGTWTAEKRHDLLEYLLTEGARTADLDAIASRLGVSRSQVVDQLKPNRSNLRKHVLEFLAGGGRT